MGKNGIGLLTLAFLLIAGTVCAQESNYNFTVQILGGYTTPGVVPFWLRSNQFGSVPLDGASLSLIGAARKDYDLSGDKLFDWGASFEGRANLGNGSNMTLIEGYGKVRLGIFELRAGRSKKITGLCDTIISSGSFPVSGNSLGIPEIEVSVSDFVIWPLVDQLFAFKGNFAHGWMGKTAMGRYLEADTILVNTFFHQKSFYVRLGKPSWSLKMYGGFNHQVIWCDGQDYYNEDFTLSSLENYLYVLTGKKFSNGYIQSERLGNHLGTVDIGIEYRWGRTLILLYRQNFYDGGALAYLANIQDGLNGVVLSRQPQKNKPTYITKLLFEFLYTKNQAGEPWSPETGSPYEPYYNHGQFIQGWSYNAIGLGTPFISTINETRAGLPSGPRYFINNRLYAFHFGAEGSVMSINYLIKASWSNNFGTYWTTDEDQSTGLPDPGSYGIFGEHKQFSTYLELKRELTKSTNIGLIGAFDYGTLLYNSMGIFLKASFSFN